MSYIQNNLFLIHSINEKNIYKLIEPLEGIISEIMFIESAGNALVKMSDKASIFLQFISPWIKDKQTQFELNGYKNIVYYSEYKKETIDIVNKNGPSVTDWTYPNLFDGLSFLRPSGDPVLHINFNCEPRLYLYENELKKFKESVLFKFNTELADTFLNNIENEKNDFYSWQILSNYHKG